MSATYINPALPSMIRGLYDADLRERSIRGMLDLAADLVQELIDTREQADPEPSDAEEKAWEDAAQYAPGDEEAQDDFVQGYLTAKREGN